ncbi:hypothetical protein DVH05_016862 [Phytophthora capsici]|nr:hypothetical protein DVH05_016862 [Phytophthora capsici]|eukprot:jgi/Phyca11/96618/e_gw1.1.1642.1
MNYHPDVIHWLRARTEIPPEHAEELVHVAAENGDVELVRVLHNAFEVEMNLALFYAVEYHRWEVVYWILDNCKLVSWDTFNSQHVVRLHKGPIRSGNLAMLQRLFDRGLVLYTENILEFAAECEQLHIVKWLHEVKGFPKVCYGYTAVKDEHLDVLAYLNDFDEKYLLDRAVTLKAVKWLHFHTNTKCSNRAMDEAAARGDLDIVQWLHTDNPWLAAGLSARC